MNLTFIATDREDNYVHLHFLQFGLATVQDRKVFSFSDMLGHF